MLCTGPAMEEQPSVSPRSPRPSGAQCSRGRQGVRQGREGRRPERGAGRGDAGATRSRDRHPPVARRLRHAGPAGARHLQVSPAGPPCAARFSVALVARAEHPAAAPARRGGAAQCPGLQMGKLRPRRAATWPKTPQRPRPGRPRCPPCSPRSAPLGEVRSPPAVRAGRASRGPGAP